MDVRGPRRTKRLGICTIVSSISKQEIRSGSGDFCGVPIARVDVLAKPRAGGTFLASLRQSLWR